MEVEVAVECFSTAMVRLREVSLSGSNVGSKTESASAQVEAVHHWIPSQPVTERQVLCMSSGTENRKRFLNEEVAAIASTMIKWFILSFIQNSEFISLLF